MHSFKNIKFTIIFKNPEISGFFVIFKYSSNSNINLKNLKT